MTSYKVYPEELKQIFRYDKETGQFFWLVDRRRAKNYRQLWITAGDIVNTPLDSRGYLGVAVKLSDGHVEQFLAHRLAWFLAVGSTPDGQIDHIDGNKLNNKFSNLRVVSNSGNMRNSKRHRSGETCGVSWDKNKCRWRARAYLPPTYKQIHLGWFKSKEDAVAAVREFKPN